MSTPGYDPGTVAFGDTTNGRPMPTSGTLVGVYRTSADWVQTGPITALEVRAYFGGNVTFNNTVTVSTVTSWAAALVVSGDTDRATGGPHGGYGGGSHSEGNIPPYGGTGNSGLISMFPLYGNNGSVGGDNGPLAGMSGAGGAAGAGGGGFYVEARGNVVLTSSAAIAANGTAGAQSGANGGGGGSGGGVDIRTMGTMTIASGATINCNAGAGGSTSDSTNGAPGGGGGGGYINLEALGGLSNSGTAQANAGAAGTGGHSGYAASAGGAGIINNNVQFTGRREAVL